MKTGIVVLLAIGIGGVVQAADWPNWRGPARDGIARESGWFKPGAAARVVWEKGVGVGHSGVVVKGGKLYTAGNADGKDGVVCLDARTGESMWRYEYPCKAGSYPGPRSTPAVDEDTVYVMSQQAEVHALDSAKGGLKWKRDLKAELGVELPKWGMAGSPVVEGGLLLLPVGPRGMVVDKKTGATKWDSGGKESGYATPVVAGEGSRRLLIQFGGKAVAGSDLMTGATQWDHPWNTSYDVNAADPVVVDGKVLITSGYDRGGALLDVSGTKPVVIWEKGSLGSHFSTPVVLDGYAYSGHGNTGRGAIRCVDIKSGDMKWEFTGIGYGSMVMADRRLLIMGDKGTMVVAEATPEQYRELWKEKVLDGTCWTVPTLCNGLIYCRNDKGRLLCLDLKGL